MEKTFSEIDFIFKYIEALWSLKTLYAFIINYIMFDLGPLLTLLVLFTITAQSCFTLQLTLI